MDTLGPTRTSSDVPPSRDRSCPSCVALVLLGLCVACGPDEAKVPDEVGASDSENPETEEESGCSEACVDLPDEGDGDGEAESEGDGDGDSWNCEDTNSCDWLDLLIVVDSSSTMAEEQLNVARNFAAIPEFIDQILHPEDGERIYTNIHIMVTSADVGHALCEGSPTPGAPVSSACLDRLDDFVLGEGDSALDLSEACTSVCPDPIAPNGDYIRYDEQGTNVPGNDIGKALSCLGPQGVRGCEYEAPLEAMLAALDPEAPWNQGPEPFLREHAPTLGIMLITDEPDCSTTPEGMAAFTDPANDADWEVDPQTGMKAPSSAICWNAGSECGALNMDGQYPGCELEDSGVLYPVSRYIDDLRARFEDPRRTVIMLPVVGVPLVTAYNPDVPFNPSAGGIMDLVYRPWMDGVFPAGDLLPDDADSAADKQFEFGIGPGCTGLDPMGEVLGQATPPLRMTRVCRALDSQEELRCCIDSICSEDFSRITTCLTPSIQTLLEPVETD